eukprot:11910703-Karenia_brevis.AAC.1
MTADVCSGGVATHCWPAIGPYAAQSSVTWSLDLYCHFLINLVLDGGSLVNDAALFKGLW